MPRDKLLNTYSERIRHFDEALRLQTRRINLLSLARFVVLVSIIWFLVLGIKTDAFLFYILSALMLVLFLYLVGIFNRHKGERELLRQLLLLNEKELACLKHDFHDLPDGSEHADTSHPWSHDLDLFGKGSLFQYLNRSSTLKGSAMLAALLTSEPGTAETILHRQKIISDLKDRIDFRQHFTASGELIKEKEGDHKDISHWLDTCTYISKYRWLFYLALGVSLLSVFIVIWGIFDPSRFLILLYLFVLNLTVLSPFFMRTQKYQEVISRKHELLEGYARLLRQICLLYTSPSPRD